METLKERVFAYEEVTDLKLTRKLPIIITLNGRGFRKTTSLLDKPYSKEYNLVIAEILIKLASEIDGTAFLYSFNDEINIVCRNDKCLETDAWYDNNIQKIISAASSMASVFFYVSAQKHNIKLLGDPIFLGKTFVLPSITETINFLIAKQHQASNTAISMACFYESLKKYDTNYCINLTKNLSLAEKYEFLTKECNLDLNSYPLAFWRGIGCYREPKMINGSMKNKLTINDELPFFNKDQSFLNNIFRPKLIN